MVVNTARANRSASLLPGGVVLTRVSECVAPSRLFQIVVFSTRAFTVGAEAGAPLPERINPSATVHSKTAKFKSAHANLTRETARTSSTVSITKMGVEELISTFRRSSGLLFDSISI